MSKLMLGKMQIKPTGEIKIIIFNENLIIKSLHSENIKIKDYQSIKFKLIFKLVLKKKEPYCLL